MKADIPFVKLDNPDFKNVFKKTGKSMSDRSTLRKSYVSNIYEGTLLKIRDFIQNSSIWIGFYL